MRQDNNIAKVIGYTRDEKGHVTGYHERDTAGTLCASNHSRTGTTAQYVSLKGCRIRKFTPRECFRLMGVSETDIDKIQAAGISDTQQYRMAGNSIVVDVLYHIFRKMFVDKDNEVSQQTLF